MYNLLKFVKKKKLVLNISNNAMIKNIFRSFFTGKNSDNLNIRNEKVDKSYNEKADSEDENTKKTYPNHGRMNYLENENPHNPKEIDKENMSSSSVSLDIDNIDAPNESPCENINFEREDNVEQKILEKINSISEKMHISK
jgi:hypothetical protein